MNKCGKPPLLLYIYKEWSEQRFVTHIESPCGVIKRRKEGQQRINGKKKRKSRKVKIHKSG
jgi:hypothetical protein